MNNSELKVEFCERFRKYDLPEEVQLALEDDYVLNRELYTNKILKIIVLEYLVCDDLTPQQALKIVRKHQNQ